MRPDTPAHPAARRARRRRCLVAGTGLLVVLAVAGSLLATAAWQRALERDRTHAFEAEAAGVGSAVGTSIQRLRDLTGAMAAMYQQNPSLTDGQFHQWVAAVGVAQRYPGVMQFGITANVQPPDLNRFLRRGRLHHLTGVVLPDPAKIGSPPYCLAPAGVYVDPAVRQYAALGAQLMCHQLLTSALYSRARDTGRAVVYSFRDPFTGKSELAIQQPVYSTQSVPTTVAARRARLLGWMGGLFNADGILASALAQHARIVLVLVRSLVR